MPPRRMRATASIPVIVSNRGPAGICASHAASERNTGTVDRTPVMALLSSAGMRSDTLIPSDSASPIESTTRAATSMVSRRNHLAACIRATCKDMV